MSPQRNVLSVITIATVALAGCATVDGWRARLDERRETKAQVLTDSTTPIASAPLRQHIGTVASVDERAQAIRLTHGPVVHVSPSTKVRFGKDREAIALRDLRPGDKVIFNVAADTKAAAEGADRGRRPISTDADSAGSALPRDVAGLATTGPLVEVLVFRPSR